MTILGTTRNSVWLSEGWRNSEEKCNVALLKLLIKHVHFSLSLNSSKHSKKKITATINRVWDGEKQKDQNKGNSETIKEEPKIDSLKKGNSHLY